MPPNYTNVHRAFLQGLLIRPFIDLEEGRELLALIKSADTGSEVSTESVSLKDVTDVIHTIQNAISPFDLEVRNMLDQEDGKRYYSLVNSSDDEIIRLATTHTPDEISFFKRLLDDMFDVNNTIHAEIMAIKGMRAISLNKNPPSERENRVVATQGANGEETTQVIAGAGIGLTKSEAEDCLARFVNEGWLERDGAGYHFLSTRSLLELEPYLLATYNVEEEEEHEDGTVTKGPMKLRIKSCYLCKYLHTIGQRCSDPACNLRMHNHCAEHYFSKNPTGKCPTCQAEWKGDPVGPKAARGGGGSGGAGLRRSRGRDSEGIQPQRLSKSAKIRIEKSKGRRSTMFDNDDDSDEDDMNEDEEQMGESSARPNGTRLSLGRRNRALTSDDEEEELRAERPRKVSRTMNGSSRRSSGMQQTQDPDDVDEDNDEDDDEPAGSTRYGGTASPRPTRENIVRVKRESMASQQIQTQDNDDEEDDELPRRMSKATLKSRRR
ncbi:hypothetical protein Dda_1404 [Drechslerella dactyloides]|uniref:Non-structural maintenance of chromosomes element 1 homolog n=1 Tax=Drechslerella dactyloides TaxID=74499 RepID=A0AAD6J2Z8_DREDA|nr:hypothetical protein Dda_1404 [Drechslerella dactyloides]